MNVNFNQVRQTPQQHPSFGVKYGFRTRDVEQLGRYLTGEDLHTLRLQKFFTGLVGCMERHNADENLHKGQLEGLATILNVQSIGCSNKIQVNAGDIKAGKPYHMFYANRKFTGKLNQAKKLFKEINAKIISNILGVSVEQKIPIVPKTNSEPIKLSLMERIRALSDESF